MADESVYSRAALEELSSGSRTDVLTNITSNWMWVLLAAISIAAGAVVYWGFFGKMADSVNGVGVTIRGGGVDAIVARGPGIIESLSIEPGMRVSKYTIVGQVYNAKNFFSLSRLELENSQLRKYLSEVERGTGELTELATDIASKKEKELEELLDKLRENRERNLEIAEMFKKSRDAQAVSKIDYYRALEQTLQVETSLSSILQQYIDSTLNRGAVAWQNERVRLTGLKDRQLKAQELDLALKMFRDSVWLRSDSDGVVVEVLKAEGDAVNLGERVAIVSTSKFPDIKVVGFVPMDQGKKVKPGMSAFFGPSSFNPGEYGYIQGVVLETSPFAVSSQSIDAELKNADLARSIGQKTVQMRVVVELIPDKKTASRYKWTSVDGAPAPLEAGSFGTLLINTGSRPPASYVVPYLRRSLFGIGAQPSDAGGSLVRPIGGPVDGSVGRPVGGETGA